MNQPMTEVASFMLKAIKAEKIDHVFLVPGAITAPFLPAYEEAGLTPIVSAQEGGAAYMADGYGRATRRFGVCMGIGGPGASNMVTAMSAAYSDRSRVLAIVGSIPFNYEGDGAFQDASPTNVDDHEIMRNLTVFTDLIPTQEKVIPFLHKAIRAMHGVENRPAFLSVPLDLQSELVEPTLHYQPLQIEEPPRILDTAATGQVLNLLEKGKRVAILLGNGSIHSNAEKAVKALTEKYNIPVVTTLRAKGAISEADEHSFGVFGLGGTLWANKVVKGSEDDGILKADVLFVLGATLNENNTYGWADDFPADKEIVRVDINPNNVIGKEYDNELRLMGDVRTFIEWMNQNEKINEYLSKGIEERSKWMTQIKQTPKYDTGANRISNTIPMHPARVIAALRLAAPKHTVMVVDSGAHTFFTGHHWESYAPNEFFFLSTTGPMGYGIAMSIGVKLAKWEQPVVCVCGDGSFLMHGMELHTAVRYNIPLVIVVINNSALGNVYLHAIETGSQSAIKLSEIPTLDVALYAKSMGAEGLVVTEPEQLAEAYLKAFEQSANLKKPFVLDIRCDRTCPTPNTGSSQPN